MIHKPFNAICIAVVLALTSCSVAPREDGGSDMEDPWRLMITTNVLEQNDVADGLASAGDLPIFGRGLEVGAEANLRSLGISDAGTRVYGGLGYRSMDFDSFGYTADELTFGVYGRFFPDTVRTEGVKGYAQIGPQLRYLNWSAYPTQLMGALNFGVGLSFSIVENLAVDLRIGYRFGLFVTDDYIYESTDSRDVLDGIYVELGPSFSL